MIQRLLFLSVLGVLVGCTNPMESLESGIVGSWELQDYGEGTYGFSQLGFTNDGRKCVVTYQESKTGFDMSMYLNSYVIVEGVLVTTLVDSSTTFEKGSVMHDRIDHLSEDKMELWMTEPPGRLLEVHQRLPDVKPERICGFVERWLGMAG